MFDNQFIPLSVFEYIAYEYKIYSTYDPCGSETLEWWNIHLDL